MNKEKVLHEAINYSIAVAKWVEDIFKWHKEQSIETQGVDDGPGTNPPPPPPPPPGV
jgi:hypothetical protein